MQVSVENVGHLERRVTVSLPSERLRSEVGTRLREIARNARIKGFRPGKVPAKVIEQRYGKQVRAEAVGELVRESFSEAVTKENLRPAGTPQIESTSDEGEELRYVATFEVVPDFGSIEVSKLKIDRPFAGVTDADVDQMIETLRLQRRSWEPVERPVQAGDLVQIETIIRADGVRVPAEGVEKGAAVIGSGVMLPALEQWLVGLRAGEEAEQVIEFPAEWRVPELAGRAATVHVKAVKVSESKLPEVDKAFIQSFGVKGGDLEQFRKDVRANLERELRGALMTRLRAEVMNKLVYEYRDVEYPPRMIEAEARALARQAEQQAIQQGRKPAPVTHEQLLPVAKKRIVAGLLVGEVARQNQLRLDPKRVSEMLALIASTYEEPQQVVEMYRNDPNLMSGLHTRVMEEQVIDWIAEHADATDQTLSFNEVMRPG